ncbi:MAG: acetyl-CoA carboxylase biotin carboxylase subunit [bacterium]|nr:acetyl-CoA carboxylase biotin carboxylase subunit [bacterium]
MPPFRKLLIANRGEIAVRVIRAARELGITTVAIHSEADANALHVTMADEAICVGPPESAGSYLNIPSVIAAAEISDAEAIHPGYGFLAENAEFAEIVENSGLIFIGPSPENIRAMGDKQQAKEIVRDAQVPIIPGSDGKIPSPEEALVVGEAIGYPLLVKAAFGGGGSGMRVVDGPDNLTNAFLMAKSEASVAFGQADVYIEKYVHRPRHVEFQIFGDKKGNIVHLGDRECSIQRRHQKLLEEAPSPVVTPELREEMGAAAVRVAKAVEYVNAGTVEFLVDEELNFYFIEMNTRMQVEHPVTEMITGIDLIKTQIEVAMGHPLPWTQEEIHFHGHAIECRINAEDPRKFTPSPGKITSLVMPGGFNVRIDTAIYPGYFVVPFYDSMIAKLIVRGRDRAQAIAKMTVALDEFAIEGIKTTIPLHREIMRDKRFQAGNYTTDFLEHTPGVSVHGERAEAPG